MDKTSNVDIISLNKTVLYIGFMLWKKDINSHNKTRSKCLPFCNTRFWSDFKIIFIIYLCIRNERQVISFPLNIFWSRKYWRSLQDFQTLFVEKKGKYFKSHWICSETLLMVLYAVDFVYVLTRERTTFSVR